MFTYDVSRARIPAKTGKYGAQPRHGRHGVLGSVVASVGRVRAAVISRHDEYVRREITKQHERLERHREVGGDFSVLP
jgi:hypothetical protein